MRRWRKIKNFISKEEIDNTFEDCEKTEDNKVKAIQFIEKLREYLYSK